MDSKPMISVIVPVYNVEPWLDECIESVVGQTYQNLEILIVNDGSTDSSGQLCEKWAKKDSRIKLFVQENAGLSAARNTGLRHATGEYYLFVDSDDYIEPNMVELLYDAITEHNADMAVCGYFVQYSNTTEQHCAECSSAITREILLERLLDATGSATCVVWNKLYPARLFDGVSFVVGRVFEDIVIFPTLISQCNRIIELSDCLYHYRIRKNSITDNMSIQNLEDQWHSHAVLVAYIDQNYPHLHTNIRTYQLKNYIVLWSKMNMVTGEHLRTQKHKSVLRNRIKENIKYIPKLKRKLQIAGYLILCCPHIYGHIYQVYHKLRHFRREKHNETTT